MLSNDDPEGGREDVRDLIRAGPGHL